jgi:uncharacterized protein (DUF885 family)
LGQPTNQRLTERQSASAGDTRGRASGSSWISALGFLLLALLAGGCARSEKQPSPATAAKQAEATFGRLADDYIAGYLVWRPQIGVALGFHEYDGMLTDFNQASIQMELERLKLFDRRLAELDHGLLTSRTYYDYRILRNAILREIFSFEQMQIYSRNPMTYAGALDVNLYVKRDFAPLEERVRSIVATLRQAPGLFSAARANLAEVLPKPEVETAIEQANGAADFLGNDLVDAVASVKNEQLMEDFRVANQRAIYELRQFATWLQEQRLPRADQSYALGREKYVKMLQYGEMVSFAPEDLLALGMSELHRKQKIFADAAHRIDPDHTPLEVFQAIQKDHPNETSLIPDTARDLEAIRRFVVDRNLVTLPSPVRARVAETPQYARATSFASMDTPGPFEARATEAYYYVTPPEPNWTADQKDEWLTSFNYYTTDIVSIHEVYPGHYVQYLCLRASSATKIEKIFSSYAFVEGWAHYAEQMMVDEGFGGSLYSGPEGTIRGAKFRMAQADEAMLRLCRLCVSIKMHCEGMTVDEATRFFHENCYYEEKPARQEAIRGSYDPEFLYYTLGKLEIFKLREDYRRQEGTDFSLRKFHDSMLRYGAPPIRLLREVLLRDPTQWDQVL